MTAMVTFQFYCMEKCSLDILLLKIPSALHGRKNGHTGFERHVDGDKFFTYGWPVPSKKPNIYLKS